MLLVHSEYICRLTHRYTIRKCDRVLLRQKKEKMPLTFTNNPKPDLNRGSTIYITDSIWNKDGNNEDST